MQNVRLKPQKSELKVWEKVRIIAGEGSGAGVFEARIEDFVAEGVVVTYPELVSGSVLLRQGLTVRVEITREDAAYQFTSIVRSYDNGTVGRRVVLTPPVSLRRIQRRQFARVDVSTQIDYALFRTSFDWSNWPDGIEWRRSRSIDISGGGVLMKVIDEVPAKALLLLKIELMREAGLPETILGLWCRQCTREESLCCGVRFLLSSELNRFVDKRALGRLPVELKAFDAPAQDRLVMYLFHKQIELRQKGLI